MLIVTVGFIVDIGNIDRNDPWLVELKSEKIEFNMLSVTVVLIILDREIYKSISEITLGIYDSTTNNILY